MQLIEIKLKMLKKKLNQFENYYFLFQLKNMNLLFFQKFQIVRIILISFNDGSKKSLFLYVENPNANPYH